MQNSKRGKESSEYGRHGTRIKERIGQRKYQCEHNKQCISQATIVKTGTSCTHTRDRHKSVAQEGG